MLINNVVKVLAIACDNKIPVKYVTVGFRAGAPEISMNNKGVSAGKERFAAGNKEEFIKIESALAPPAGEVIVTKLCISAFTNLEVILWAHGIQYMVLTGFATSGILSSTIRKDADKDYRITVLADCRADGDNEVRLC